MAHLKRLRTQRSWPIRRKGITFITRPSAGPHRADACLPLIVALRDVLQLASTAREARSFLREGKVLVDGVARKDTHFPVGVLDSIAIPEMKKAWRVYYSQKGKFMIQEISTEKAKEKTRKIVNKHLVAKKKLQLNFHDGHNLVVEKDAYKTGDSVIMTDKKISKHLKLEAGVAVYLIGGRHVGATGVVKEIKNFKGMEKNRIVLEIDGKKVETLKDYAFVVDPKEIKA